MEIPDENSDAARPFDEQQLPIDSELRPLMSAQRVLDGEIMQSDAWPHRAIRLVQADPDEAWPFPVRRDSFSPTR